MKGIYTFWRWWLTRIHNLTWDCQLFV